IRSAHTRFSSRAGLEEPSEVSAMPRRFATLDVFTRKRFAGNPLAVVLEADGLDGATMQTIAREFNLAETVFVLPAEQAGHRARLRIFTPAAELPFAGHPTVGTAVLLNRIDGRTGRHEIVLEEGIGPVRCMAQAHGADAGHARFELARLPSELEGAPDRAALAAALGIETTDLGFDAFLPGRWSAGVSFTFVPLRGLDAIRRCRVATAHWEAAFGPSGDAAAYMFCSETLDAASAFHARMFAPRMG